MVAVKANTRTRIVAIRCRVLSPAVSPVYWGGQNANASPLQIGHRTLSILQRLLSSTLACIVAELSFATAPALGQTATQMQYFYDAAGNLVQVTRTPTTPQPDLTVTKLAIGAISANANLSYNIPVTFQVNNVGTATAAATWYDRGYLSANSTLHDTDQALGGYNTRTTNLAVVGSYAVTATFTTSTTTPAGNYTLIVKADGGAGTGQFSSTGANNVAESNELNNIQTAVIALPANPKPDLAISNVSVGSITTSQAGAYKILATYTVTNLGVMTAKPNWYDLAYLSADATLDTADQNLGGYTLRNTLLAAGASYMQSTTFTTTVATAPGNYTLFVKADGHGPTVGGINTDNGALAESNEANNIQALTLALPSKPDLAISNVSVGAITISRAGAYNIPVTYTVTNVGGLSAPPNWYDLAYLSADVTLDTADQNFGGYTLRNTALAAGASYTQIIAFTTTAATTPGTYTLFVKTDGHGTTVGGNNTDNGALAESNEANNIQALTLILPNKPDLAISNMSVGPIAKNANGTRSVPITYTVTNTGGLAAPPNWYDLAYLSADATLDTADQNLGGYTLRNTALAAGASYTQTTTFSATAATVPGTYTLFVKTDGHGATVGGTNTDSGALAENNEANNLGLLTVTLP